jgi:hypothetical protein
VVREFVNDKSNKSTTTTTLTSQAMKKVEEEEEEEVGDGWRERERPLALELV